MKLPPLPQPPPPPHSSSTLPQQLGGGGVLGHSNPWGAAQASDDIVPPSYENQVCVCLQIDLSLLSPLLLCFCITCLEGRALSQCLCLWWVALLHPNRNHPGSARFTELPKTASKWASTPSNTGLNPIAKLPTFAPPGDGCYGGVVLLHSQGGRDVNGSCAWFGLICHSLAVPCWCQSAHMMMGLELDSTAVVILLRYFMWALY